MSRQWCRWRQRRPPLLRCWCSMRAARGHRCSLDERTAVNRQAGHTYIHLHGGKDSRTHRTADEQLRLAMGTAARRQSASPAAGQRASTARCGEAERLQHRFLAYERLQVSERRARRGRQARSRARGRRLSRLFLWVDTNYTIIYMNMAPVASALCRFIAPRRCQQGRTGGRNFKQRLAIRARGSERWVGASAHGGGGGRCCARGR